jgi:hypothetical protein
LALLAAFPLAHRLPALAVLAILAAVLCAVITYETIGYGAGRTRLRHEMQSG